ncbi:MAG: decarboxylating NADP(+)-dependent phosphogluconate dehydrogenase [Trueperaceae bacterium]|nr:decarboxylating NADP(+)-dependent phosphogluconate dehydrogenase [Trueperaceae bacterium]
MAQADIGLIGLAVMGQNLVLNMNDHGYKVAVYNRTTEKMTDFVEGPAKDTRVEGYAELKDMVDALQRPRRVMLMIKAGAPVDKVIDQLLPLLDAGDIIIDGGNAYYGDTVRRAKDLEEKGFRFIGTGISGGEEGARHGPSIMPGGSDEAWPYVKDIFQSIAAQVDGEPCCEWLGRDGAGHFVKMVHNGIEYGDMQLIAETYQLMHEGLELSHSDMSDVFARWNEGRLKSFLIEITADILAYRDDEGDVLLEKILDAAKQKGTGKWTSQEALDEGIPLTLISEAVFARMLSAFKDERVAASKVLTGPSETFDGDKDAFVDDLETALYASKVVAYAQGYMLFRSATEEFGWDFDYSTIAKIWRDGCIIRSVFLNDIMAAYERDPNLANLLLDDFFKDAVNEAQQAWRRVVARAVTIGIPVPATSSALAFYDGYRHDRLPANMIQAQRDYFGAHTYERVDTPRGEYFHTDWTGRGGKVSSSSYEA